MPNTKPNKTREHRIDMEIVVDAHNKEERVMGWYYYLKDVLEFPFKAECITKRVISPLKKGEVVVVKEMADLDECQNGMFVEIEFQGSKLAVPLTQLKPINAKAKTKEAIDDWHYWVEMGYQF